MDGSARVVIVGAGHAGGAAAAALRQFGWTGPITLIGQEPLPPYQRPPLSKAWLKGEADANSLLLRPLAFYANNGIALHLSQHVQVIDRRTGCVVLGSGERIPYDRVILATGSLPRQLTLPGADRKNVMVLRSAADADRLKAALAPGVRLLVIGGGYIGLEVAASARALGADVTVIERESRVMARVASPLLSDFLQQRHAAYGVRLELGAELEALHHDKEAVTGVRLRDGRTIGCDVVLIGVGAVANDLLAREAGLECDGGVWVDAAARSSDPAIYAIGDCTRRPVPRYGGAMRLESVPNALEMAKQAAADLCGRKPPPAEVPWFWSDQFDLRLQIAGLLFDVAETVLRGDLRTGSFALFHLSAHGMVQAVEAVNTPADFMAGKQMIARRQRVAALLLRDVSCSLPSLLAGQCAGAVAPG